MGLLGWPLTPPPRQRPRRRRHRSSTANSVQPHLVIAFQYRHQQHPARRHQLHSVPAMPGMRDRRSFLPSRHGTSAAHASPAAGRAPPASWKSRAAAMPWTQHRGLRIVCVDQMLGDSIGLWRLEPALEGKRLARQPSTSSSSPDFEDATPLAPRWKSSSVNRPTTSATDSPYYADRRGAVIPHWRPPTPPPGDARSALGNLAILRPQRSAGAASTTCSRTARVIIASPSASLRSCCAAAA